MVSQAPSPELIQQAIEANLAPTIHFKILPRALDILAHAALLASKLAEEITRILDSDAQVAQQGGDLGLGSHSVKALQKSKVEAAKVSALLWQVSVQFRLHHVAAVLAPDKNFSAKILSLIECYFPTPQIHGQNEPSSSKHIYKSSKLFIRAMPPSMTRELDKGGELAREWYQEASERSSQDVDQGGTRHLHSGKDNAARLAGEAISLASRVVDCIRRVEGLLVGEIRDESTTKVVKEEDTPGNRRSRSPSPGHLSKIPQLTFTRTKKRLSSTRVSLTPITPTVQPQRQTKPRPQARLANPLGSERTTSLMETEAILDMSMDESDDDAREVHEREGVSNRGSEEKPTVRSKMKKRPRPSLPPREGPDYTRPLGRAAPHKKPRTFTSEDLRR